MDVIVTSIVVEIVCAGVIAVNCRDLNSNAYEVCNVNPVLSHKVVEFLMDSTQQALFPHQDTHFLILLLVVQL